MEGAAEGPTRLHPRLQRRQQPQPPKHPAQRAGGRAVARDGENPGVAEGLPSVYDRPLPAAAAARHEVVEAEGRGRNHGAAEEESGGHGEGPVKRGQKEQAGSDGEKAQQLCTHASEILAWVGRRRGGIFNCAEWLTGYRRSVQ